eukprot:CAMPEP_0178389384 /NCGR_PEP_ID=MMETSP0689_2-20121128/10088_1 /TAXON_ID=160604 /ORGANISM="Amphidinium massartii, Strain CS-259" /LENGTH=58 /DNA_ID=CAMNT_0020009831 /DNA_START=218 /DNA_END=394 /DNA_ORIENTATION=-
MTQSSVHFVHGAWPTLHCNADMRTPRKNLSSLFHIPTSFQLRAKGKRTHVAFRNKVVD